MCASNAKTLASTFIRRAKASRTCWAAASTAAAASRPCSSSSARSGSRCSPTKRDTSRRTSSTTSWAALRLSLQGAAALERAWRSAFSISVRLAALTFVPLAAVRSSATRSADACSTAAWAARSSAAISSARAARRSCRWSSSVSSWWATLATPSRVDLPLVRRGSPYPRAVMLAGLPVSEAATAELAGMVRAAGAEELADRLDRGLDDDVKLLALTIDERAVILAALEDPAQRACRVARRAPQRAPVAAPRGAQPVAGHGPVRSREVP